MSKIAILRTFRGHALGPLLIISLLSCEISPYHPCEVISLVIKPTFDWHGQNPVLTIFKAYIHSIKEIQVCCWCVVVILLAYQIEDWSSYWEFSINTVTIKHPFHVRMHIVFGGLLSSVFWIIQTTTDQCSENHVLIMYLANVHCIKKKKNMQVICSIFVCGNILSFTFSSPQLIYPARIHFYFFLILPCFIYIM